MRSSSLAWHDWQARRSSLARVKSCGVWHCLHSAPPWKLFSLAAAWWQPLQLRALDVAWPALGWGSWQPTQVLAPACLGWSGWTLVWQRAQAWSGELRTSWGEWQLAQSAWAATRGAPRTGTPSWQLLQVTALALAEVVRPMAAHARAVAIGEHRAGRHDRLGLRVALGARRQRVGSRCVLVLVAGGAGLGVRLAGRGVGAAGVLVAALARRRHGRPAAVRSMALGAFGVAVDGDRRRVTLRLQVAAGAVGRLVDAAVRAGRRAGSARGCVNAWQTVQSARASPPKRAWACSGACERLASFSWHDAQRAGLAGPMVSPFISWQLEQAMASRTTCTW